MAALAQISLIAFVLMVSACANPLNEVTSDRYAEQCSEAERAGQLAVAEQACYRALVNVDWGNLGPLLKSQRLYNLARVKRQLSKFAEAEDLAKQSLLIETGLTGEGSVTSGRRYVELAASLGAQKKWSEGSDYADRALPVADKFNGSERAFFKNVLAAYGSALRSEGRAELASKFDARAATL